MKNSKLLLKTLLVISILLLPVGCQQNSTPVTPETPTTTTTTNQDSTQVTIKNFAFDQNNLTISPNTKVIWTNTDSVAHTITSDTGAFGSNNLSKDESFEFTFKKEGTYAYHCAIHPSMKGVITVKKLT